MKTAKADKDKAVREATSQMEKKEQQRINEDKKRINALERKIKELETAKPAVRILQFLILFIAGM